MQEAVGLLLDPELRLVPPGGHPVQAALRARLRRTISALPRFVSGVEEGGIGAASAVRDRAVGGILKAVDDRAGGVCQCDGAADLVGVLFF